MEMRAYQPKPSGNQQFPHLKRRLKQLSKERGPHAKLPTIRQLCADLNTNTAVMDWALKELEAQGVIYRKHGSGIFVAPEISRKTIALVYGSNYLNVTRNSPFWDMLFHLIAKEAQDRASRQEESFSFHIASPGDNESDIIGEGFLDALESGRLDGVLVVSVSQPICDWLSERVPLISFASDSQENVQIDEREMSRLAVSSLSADGCRRIGAWLPGFVTINDVRRSRQVQHGDTICQYFVGAMKEQDLEFDPVYSHFNYLNAELANLDLSSHEQGYRLARKVFGHSNAPKPDGIYFMNDEMAAGALMAFLKMGVRVGQDIKVVTHANAGSMILFGFERDVTLVEVDPREIVRQMFEALDLKFAGKPVPLEVKIVRAKLRTPNRVSFKF